MAPVVEVSEVVGPKVGYGKTRLKIYLNEEIQRLKEKINKALQLQEIKDDQRMHEKTNKLLNWPHWGKK